MFTQADIRLVYLQTVVLMLESNPSYAICGASLELWGRVIELAENAMQELGLTEGDYSVDAVMDSGRSSAATCGINPA